MTFDGNLVNVPNSSAFSSHAPVGAGSPSKENPRRLGRVKWGYSTARLPFRPGDAGHESIRLDDEPPRPGDVLIAEVMSIGRHTRIDTPSRTKSKLFEGDHIGVVFAPRYATRQFQAIVPADLSEVHLVCAGGVCGRVVGQPDDMNGATVIRPVGYLTAHGRRVRMPDHSIKKLPYVPGRTEVIAVVGSSMDSGKTTAAYSLAHGLKLAGLRVGAAKITGTASAKDPMLFVDAGAEPVLDFTDLGLGSTAGLSRDEIREALETLLGSLQGAGVDVAVIEIADGIVQTETRYALELMAKMSISGILFTCSDAVAVAGGVARVESYGHDILAVSGTCTRSPLAIVEAQNETTRAVLSKEELMVPEAAKGILRRAQDLRRKKSEPTTGAESDDA